MPFSNKTSKNALNASERRIQALDLRKKGLTFKAIGAELGCSEQRAWKIVTTELNKIHLKISENSEEIKTLELQRLDSLYEAVLKKAIIPQEDEETPPEVNLYAVDRCLRIMERRARLLGLDSPEKLEVDENAKVIFHLPEPETEEDE